LIITGGVTVLPSGTEPADVAVSGGKVVAIGAPGTLASTGAARVIDAAGQIVIPGGIDPHIHCNSPIPFPGRNEDLLSAPPEQVSRAAPLRRHNDFARFCALSGGSAIAAVDRAAQARMGRRMLLRLRISSAAARQAVARGARSAARGDPGRSR